MLTLVKIFPLKGNIAFRFYFETSFSTVENNIKLFFKIKLSEDFYIFNIQPEETISLT